MASADATALFAEGTEEQNSGCLLYIPLEADGVWVVASGLMFVC